MECYDWIVKESIRYGDKWKKQWAQEYARKRLVLELPTILAVYAQPVHKTLFPTWSHYLQEYMIVGMCQFNLLVEPLITDTSE